LIATFNLEKAAFYIGKSGYKYRQSNCNKSILSPFKEFHVGNK